MDSASPIAARSAGQPSIASGSTMNLLAMVLRFTPAGKLLGCWNPSAVRESRYRDLHYQQATGRPTDTREE